VGILLDAVLRNGNPETQSSGEKRRNRKPFRGGGSGAAGGREWLADDAVWREPVSRRKFPANREKYREIPRDIGLQVLFAAQIDCDIADFGEIPYANEQGMSRGITGKTVLKAGNFPLSIPALQMAV
jgi:hypothetical protein